MPGGDASDHIRRVGEADVLEPHGGEARRVALPADDDEPGVERELGIRRPDARVEPPEHGREGVVLCAGHEPTLAAPLVLAARVDEHGAVLSRAPRLRRRQAP
jgi:hypothetical protein